jgi:hypothetical protein
MLAACFESCLRIFAFECARCCEHHGLHIKQDPVETYVLPASNAGGMLESCLRIFAFECARCCEHHGLHVKQDLVETYVFPASKAGGKL